MNGFDLLVDTFAGPTSRGARLVIGGDRAMLGTFRDRTAPRARRPARAPGVPTGRHVAEEMAAATVVVDAVAGRRSAVVVLEAWRSAPRSSSPRAAGPHLVTDGVTGLVVDPEDRDTLAACVRRWSTTR